MVKFRALVAGLAASALSIGGAQAAIINFTATAIVDSAIVGNAYNLGVGDLIFISGQYDDSALDAFGNGQVDFSNAEPSNLFEIAAGAFTLTNSQDVDFTDGSGVPFIDFNMWEVAGFDYIVQGVGGNPNLNFEFIGDHFMSDELVPNGSTPTTERVISGQLVDEPGTIAILGLGLIAGGIAIRRRRR